MPEKIVPNYEFSFILKKGDEIYDLGLCDTITDNYTTTTTDVVRYSYKGLTGKVPTSSTFQVTCTGINDQNNPTYKLFKKLYGGNLLDLQGYTLEMSFPLADDEIEPKKLTVPSSISFSAGFAAGANDLSKFSVDIVSTGAIKITNSVTKDQVNLNLKLTQTDLGKQMFDDNHQIANGILAGIVITENSELTINDFWIAQEDVKWDLQTNTGTAIAEGVGKYYGKVNLTFQLEPTDVNRPTE